MPTSLLVIARGVEIGASLLVAGIFTFEILVARDGRQSAAQANPAERRLLRLALWGLAAAFLAALLWFAFEVANMSGLPLMRAFSGGSWETVLSATRFGHVWPLRLGLITACLALVALRLRPAWSTLRSDSLFGSSRSLFSSPLLGSVTLLRRAFNRSGF